MEKRYQVFISSTYENLKEERKSIIKILLNAKYVPAGMEMFAASNEEQFKYIKKIIDNCCLMKHDFTTFINASTVAELTVL